MSVLIIAHRACPQHAPENSIEGIRRAAELGAGGVEVDVQRTLDGVPVLMHDWTLGRTAGLPFPVRLLPYALARRLRLQGRARPLPSRRAAPPPPPPPPPAPPPPRWSAASVSKAAPSASLPWPRRSTPCRTAS